MKIVNNVEKVLIAESTTQGITTEAVSLKGAVGFALQADIAAAAATAKTFDSGKQALLVDQSITYTAVERGTAGNSITIELVDTGVPSQALTIDVTGTAISVELALDAGVASELEEQDLTYTAVDVGESGDDITITYVDDGTAGDETVDVTGTDIVVHMEAAVSTATEILTAIEASAPASALVTVAVTGTGSNAQTAVAETPLAGGQNPAITTDADALVAALDLDPEVIALIDASGTGNTPLTALEATPLATGTNPEVDVETSEMTIPSHGYTTGRKGQLTTTGTLPAPLTTGVDYYVIAVDANTIQLAASLSDALAGTEIELSDQGTNGAVNTFTPGALAGGSIKLQQRLNDSMDWIDITSSSNNITTSASFSWNYVDVNYGQFRAVLALTAGQLDVDLQAVVRVLT